jgi:hypothetical protein
LQLAAEDGCFGGGVVGARLSGGRVVAQALDVVAGAGELLAQGRQILPVRGVPGCVHHPPPLLACLSMEARVGMREAISKRFVSLGGFAAVVSLQCQFTVVESNPRQGRHARRVALVGARAMTYG